jgi:hypothetical protein
MLEKKLVPEKVEPFIYRRKEKAMVIDNSKKITSDTTCRFSPWTGFKILVTASLLTVNLNISNNIEVHS